MQNNTITLRDFLSEIARELADERMTGAQYDEDFKLDGLVESEEVIEIALAKGIISRRYVVDLEVLDGIVANAVAESGDNYVFALDCVNSQVSYQ